MTAAERFVTPGETVETTGVQADVRALAETQRDPRRARTSVTRFLEPKAVARTLAGGAAASIAREFAGARRAPGQDQWGRSRGWSAI